MNTNRVDAGVPAGGQFAPHQHSEPAVNLTAPRPEPIMASVDLEMWVNDYSQTIETVTFDATPILAAMDADERDDLSDGLCDLVYERAVTMGLVKSHDGPFTVYVEESLHQALEADPDYFDKYAAAPALRPQEAILDEPLSPYELGARIDGDGWVTGRASFDISDMLEGNLDAHLDQVSVKLTGSELLMENEYKPVAIADDGSIVMEISGNISQIVENFDDDEREQFEAGRKQRTPDQ